MSPSHVSRGLRLIVSCRVSSLRREQQPEVSEAHFDTCGHYQSVEDHFFLFCH